MKLNAAVVLPVVASMAVRRVEQKIRICLRLPKIIGRVVSMAVEFNKDE